MEGWKPGSQEGRQTGRKARRLEGWKPGSQEGRKAGRQEGRKAGRQEGRKAGRQEGRKAVRQEGRKAGSQEGRKAGRSYQVILEENIEGREPMSSDVGCPSVHRSAAKQSYFTKADT